MTTRDKDADYSMKELSKNGLSYKESAFNKLKSQINKNKYVYGGIGLIVIIGLIALLS